MKRAARPQRQPGVGAARSPVSGSRLREDVVLWSHPVLQAPEGGICTDSSRRDGQGSALTLSSPMRQDTGQTLTRLLSDMQGLPHMHAGLSSAARFIFFGRHLRLGISHWLEALFSHFSCFFPSLKYGSHTMLLSVLGVQHGDSAFILETDYITY